MESLDRDLFVVNHAQFMSLGFDEASAIQNALAQTFLMQATALLNGGQYENDGTEKGVLIVAGGSGDEADALVPNDVLLPDLRNFASALSSAEPRDEPYIHLHLQQIQLVPEVSNLLLESFEKAPIRDLSLCENGPSSAGAKFAIRALETNPALRRLDLSHNRIESAADAISLAEKAVAHPSLAIFGLNKCGPIGRNNKIMTAIVPSLLNGLKGVSLQDIGIGSHGAQLISNCLVSNPDNLEMLSLDDNLLSDDDVALIAVSLKTNDRLRFIALEGNFMTQDGVGVEALSASVLGTGSFEKRLNSLHEANHTCQIWLSEDHWLSRVNRHSDPNNLNRKEKLLTFLLPANEDYTNIRCLDDVPIGIMPRVLAFLQDRNGIEFTLPRMTRANGVYQLVRQWSMPLLYISPHKKGSEPRRSDRIRRKKVLELIGNKTE